MKKAILAITATLAIGFSAPVFAAEQPNIIMAQGWNDDYRDTPPPPRGYEMERRDRRYRGEVISPRRVARMLERRSYEVRDVDLRRSRYFVRAIRPNGRRVMLVVNARNGRILDERRAGGSRRSGFSIEINP
ncbi:antifreeze protein [Phyllobacterium phragmitis]|uniref:Antifreeze protein n=1 Tax=Phyllobacterium phragmitis TaxID=2670329 RepID=A0A2S9IQC1_9HYPH|nr:antifreeze protein [Phyllobacterium phragmitis]PRD42728.1 antifreeze protein [Phyllobacterium phragmitis]